MFHSVRKKRKINNFVKYSIATDAAIFNTTIKLLNYSITAWKADEHEFVENVLMDVIQLVDIK